MIGFRYSTIASVILVANAFLLRPAAFGQNLSSVALVVSVVFLFFHLFSAKNSRKNLYDLDNIRAMKKLIALVFFYLFYVLLLFVIFQKSNLDYLLKEIVLTVGVVISYSVFLSRTDINEKFFNLMATLVSIIGWSGFFTILISQFVDVQLLRVGGVEIEGYESYAGVDVGGIYFPFTMIYGNFTTGDFVFYRVSGFFREPGIYQAICCSLVLYEGLGRCSKMVLIGLILGCILSLSSIGVLLLPMTLALLYALKKRKVTFRIFFALLSIPFGAFLIMNLPGIGLADKLVTHSTSISDRTEAMLNGVNSLWINPLGYGLFGNASQNSGINMIAALGSIGVVGFILQFFILSGYRFNLNYSSICRIGFCVPIVVTSVFSQPIYGAPMVYIFTMVFFRKKYD